MPKKHIIASAAFAASAVPASAAATAPSLPARFLEILIALPIFAWVENPKGKILAHNCGLATPATVIALSGKRGASGASWKIVTYPLPPIKGCPRRLRLVALVSGASKNDCHARVISTLLSLLLGAPRPDSLQLTPQQHDIYRELSRGSRYKEIAYTLGLTHNALHVQITRMRKRLGEGIIPRRRCASASKRC